MSNLVAMNRQEFEEYIEHYGKKGMKWGVRKQFSGSNRAKNEVTKAREQTGRITTNRQNAKGERVAFRKDWKGKTKLEKRATIEKARRDLHGTKRGGINSKDSKAMMKFQKAKDVRNSNKAKLGSREANKIFKKHKRELQRTIAVANSTKNGKEFVSVLLLGGYGLAINRAAEAKKIKREKLVRSAGASSRRT